MNRPSSNSYPSIPTRLSRWWEDTTSVWREFDMEEVLPILQNCALEDKAVLNRRLWNGHSTQPEELINGIFKALPCKRPLFIQKMYREVRQVGIWERGIVVIAVDLADSSSLIVDLASLNPDHLAIVGDLCKDLRQEKFGEAYAFTQTATGISTTSVGLAAVPLIADNYSPGVLTGFHHVVEDLQSPSPCGRLSVLTGPPGCGKTYLIRALLDEVTTGKFILVPPGLTSALSGPNLIGTLLGMVNQPMSGSPRPEPHPLILILEDADECLVPRGPDNMAAVSSLLNLTDGILGACLDLRVVCTTNAKHVEMDPAIMRPGRLCRELHLAPLALEQARIVYRRLTQKDTDILGPVSLAEIYTLAKTGKVQPGNVEHSVGFTLTP